MKSRTIALTRGKFAQVDAEDFESLSKFKWHVCGHYAARKVGGRKIFMHRVVANAIPGLEVDHIDNDKMNNTRANLRICSHGANMQNRIRKDNKSGYIGVYFRKPTKRCWGAQIRYNKKAVHLGFFDDKKDAAMAYDKAAVQYFGKSARLNFPEAYTQK